MAGRLEEMRGCVAGLVRTFRRCGIHRGALVALMLLEEALVAGLKAGAILDSVSELIHRAENDPGVTFDGWFLAG